MRYWRCFRAVFPAAYCHQFRAPIRRPSMPDARRSQPPKLLDEVRQVLRLHHYSIHTERSYVDWIVRFVRFHGMRSRCLIFYVARRDRVNPSGAIPIVKEKNPRAFQNPWVHQTSVTDTWKLNIPTVPPLPVKHSWLECTVIFGRESITDLKKMSIRSFGRPT